LAGDDKDVVFVLRSMPRYRALLLTFERMGIRDATTYAAAVRHAAKLAASSEGRRGYVAQAQLQGSLALLSRLVAVGTLDAPAAEGLVQELVAVPIENGGYAGGIARWLRDRLHPALPAARDYEAALVAGLAGPPPPADAPRATWEGQSYRLDLAASEANRLRQVRMKQNGAPLDVAM